MVQLSENTVNNLEKLYNKCDTHKKNISYFKIFTLTAKILLLSSPHLKYINNNSSEVKITDNHNIKMPE